MSCYYPKSARIRTRRQYQRFTKHSIRYVGCWIIIDTCTNKSGSTRLGITASKHYGNAVQRNRFKRIVREAFRLCRIQLTPGVDINVKPRQMAHKANTVDVLDELVLLIGQKVAASV